MKMTPEEKINKEKLELFFNTILEKPKDEYGHCNYILAAQCLGETERYEISEEDEIIKELVDFGVMIIRKEGFHGLEVINKNIAKSEENQGKAGVASGASKIGPSTKFETISERLSPFGGLLGLVKFMDLVKFKEIFDGLYIAPSRKPVLGHYNMVYGLLILLFIGFNRVGIFYSSNLIP